ncbi:MAG: hypothetical protein WAT93_02610 [Pontixanthobacter sp.]
MKLPGRRAERNRQWLVVAASAAVALGPMPATAADEQQLQQFLKIYREAQYVLAADQVCGVLTEEQRVAVDFVREHNWQVLLQDVSASTLVQYSATELGKTDWAQCPKRGEKPEQWRVVDHYRVMGDAMAAAASVAEINPAQCKIGASKPDLSSEAITRVARAMEAKYQGTTKGQSFVQQREIFAANIANNCNLGGETGMLEPAFEADRRLSLPIDQQNRKMFVGLSGNVPVYGHRFAVGSSAPLAKAALNLGSPSQGMVYVTISEDGTWRIDVPESVTAIDLRDNFGNTGTFRKVPDQTASEARSIFEPDAPGAKVLAGTINAARVSLRFQTAQSADDWQFLTNSSGTLAEVHLEAVRNALKWAKFYTLEELQ